MASVYEMLNYLHERRVKLNKRQSILDSTVAKYYHALEADNLSDADILKLASNLKQILYYRRKVKRDLSILCRAKAKNFEDIPKILEQVAQKHEEVTGKSDKTAKKLLGV